jgi:hypothetical protein
MTPPETEGQGATDGAPRVKQADDLVERVSSSVADVVSRVVARTREEAEDLWAEAKSVRHGQRSSAGE